MRLQGCSAALEDVALLSASFAAAGDDIPRALAAYDRRRRPQVCRCVCTLSLCLECVCVLCCVVCYACQGMFSCSPLCLLALPVPASFTASLPKSVQKCALQPLLKCGSAAPHPNTLAPHQTPPTGAVQAHALQGMDTLLAWLRRPLRPLIEPLAATAARAAWACLLLLLHLARAVLPDTNCWLHPSPYLTAMASTAPYAVIRAMLRAAPLVTATLCVVALCGARAAMDAAVAVLVGA